MTSDEQLEKWVAGESVHNGKSRKEGYCTPDFSCCNENVSTPISERVAFRDADERGREAMLMMFLGKAFSAEKIYIAGDETNYQEPS